MPAPLRSTLHLLRFELRRIARVPTVMGYFLGPLLVYPALIWGELQVFSLMAGERATETYRVAVADAELEGLLDDAERVRIVPASQASPDALDRSDVDAYVTQTDEGLVVHHAAWSLSGGAGADHVKDELKRGGTRRAREAFLDAGGAESIWDGHDITLDQPAGASDALLRRLLGLLVGLMTPLSVLVTASQPACAVFLSDREEGTAETLLTARVPRSALAFGKIGAVAALLMLSAMANIVLLWAACMQALSVLSEQVVFLWPTASGLAIATLALGTYSLLLTLLLTTLLVPLRTYKEGQNLGSTASLPVMVPLLVGLLSMMDVPAPWMWWAPVVHTPLVIDAAVRGTWTAMMVVQSVGVDLLIATLWAALLWRFPGPEGLVMGAWRPAWFDRFLGTDT